MMILSETAEEILESLWILQEESGKKRFRLAELSQIPEHAVLQELLETKILKRCGDEHFELTETGFHEARDAIRRHRLSERLLADLLSIKSTLLHDTACQFEHHLHRGVDTNVCTLLGHPKSCPHGRPIPPGRCCEEGQRIIEQAFAALSQLKPGDGGEVAYLHTSDPKQAQMLISMGVVPGAAISLLAGFPSFLFQIGESQFAVDREIAGAIQVRLGKTSSS